MQITRKYGKCHVNKAKAISAKLWLSSESTRKVLRNVGDILVLMTFQFWWHFSFGDILVQVTLLLWLIAIVYCLMSTVYCLDFLLSFIMFLGNFGRFGTVWEYFCSLGSLVFFFNTFATFWIFYFFISGILRILLFVLTSWFSFFFVF